MTAVSRRLAPVLLAAATALVAALCLDLVSSRPASLAVEQDPWTADQVMTPASLVKELSREASTRPAVACVAFDFLYRGAHVPGAVFLGPGRDPNAIATLTKWARELPSDQEVVLYCGCCPWSRCPNIRPAYRALADLGFKRVRVVRIDRDFGRDWVTKGYPVEKAN